MPAKHYKGHQGHNCVLAHVATATWLLMPKEGRTRHEATLIGTNKVQDKGEGDVHCLNYIDRLCRSQIDRLASASWFYEGNSENFADQVQYFCQQAIEWQAST